MYNENRRGPPGQSPEKHNYLSKPRAITIYRNKLFAIRKVGFKPVI